ncbi:dof zinc finger protein DOF1.3 [Lathyrus oleraceus]|uniref:Dof-type domain-containing protein n=1 Tax=Pisum sativum TaxID=3888 RepID=A0A9D5GWC4_PEA|nr:dof zinc finger protein DOF1.3-like [Pisum sativum]KAI5443582.1 hypothetical protein KIW84_012285 [Pisum sativum]
MNSEGDMCVKDSSIMLFGKKIPVPEYHIPASSQMRYQIQANSTTMNSCGNSKHKEVEMPHTKNFEKLKNSSNEENESKVTTTTVESISIDQEKVLKKPDKIVQCPRCNSYDTKFCYFNNYNANQPRHFCRNCHRYWTAGGAMRNVAVGTGRRKNKHIDSRYFHKRNVDASGNNCRENGDEESLLCVSSVINGYTRGNELFGFEQNRSKQLQSYLSSPWMIPLNQRWNNVTSMVQSSMQMCNPFGIDPNAMLWCHVPMVAVTNIFSTPNIGLQIVPRSYGNENVSIGSKGCMSHFSSTIPMYKN